MLKKLLSLILVLSMLMTLSLSLVSCGGDDENDGGSNNGEGTNDENKDDNKEDETPKKVTYKVTVVDEDGNPVKGVNIIFFPKGDIPTPFKTDENGLAPFVTDKELTVSVGFVPAGYGYDTAKTHTFDAEGKLTITLSKSEETGTKYTIRVIDQNGAPVVGAKVQMCQSADEGICLIPVTTNENGEGIYMAEERDYKAAITSLPEGYEKISDDYTYFDNYVAQIVVNKVAE